ncbi:MAG: 5'/3'-nucleotidase SurE [Thermoleophilaceae bacterium]
MRVLLTNDDGIAAAGLNVMRRALLELPGIELSVIAPDSNRSASGRSITTRSPLWVEEIHFGDGSIGYATDGTPVDCVRFAALGLVGQEPELIVSGINHGSNLGDDITYSGTVAAALEGVVLGVPAVAVSQQSRRGEMDFRQGDEFDFEQGAAFVARLVGEIEDVPLPSGSLLNVNAPAVEARGTRVCRLGKRIYNDRLELDEERGGHRRYRIYGDDPGYEEGEGTDFAAVAEGLIAVTPLHFDLTDRAGIEGFDRFDLDRLLVPAAREA